MRQFDLIAFLFGEGQITEKGGVGSGNHGHSGRKGLRGGSAPSGEKSSPKEAGLFGFDAKNTDLSVRDPIGDMSAWGMVDSTKLEKSLGIDAEKKEEFVPLTPQFAKNQAVRGVLSNLPKDTDLSVLGEFVKSDRYSAGTTTNDGKGNYSEVLTEEEALRLNIVDTVLDQWSSSSADHSVRSLEFQVAVAREFGLGEARVQRRLTDALIDPHNHKYVNKDDFNENGTEKLTRTREGFELDPEKSDIRVSALRPIARAMYDNTQEFLKRNDIGYVTVFRGTKRDGAIYWPNLTESDKTEGKEISLDGINPISSWSTSKRVAAGFGLGGLFQGEKGTSTVIKTIVPAQAILAVPSTGIGCLGEREVTVLVHGGVGRAWYNNDPRSSSEDD